MRLEKFPGNDDRLSGQMQKLEKPLEMAHSALGRLKYENVYSELFLMVIDSNVENTECRIWHHCPPLQIVSPKPNVENYNEAL